jgi:hypothetical protein
MDLQSLIPHRAIEAEPWPSYVLDREGGIAYANAAWDRGARSPATSWGRAGSTPWQETSSPRSIGICSIG